VYLCETLGFWYRWKSWNSRWLYR